MINSFVIFSPAGGSTDDVSKFTALVAACSNKRAIVFSSGTFLIGTAGPKLITGTVVVGNPGAKLKSTNPSHGILDATFLVAEPASTNTGTINTNVTVNSRTVLVNMTTKPTVGKALNIGNGTCQQIYIVEAVSGSTSPYTVTVDRPIVWPFLASGSAASEFDSIPSFITIDGRGIQLSGLGTQAIELATGYRVNIYGVHYIQGDGDVVGSPYGFDVSCQECLMEDWTSNSANNSAGHYFQSNERSIVRRGKVRNGGSGVGVFDSYQTGVADHWTYDTTNASVGAINISRIDSSAFGCIECWVDGGGVIGHAGPGISIDHALRTKINNHVMDLCSGGLYLTSGAIDSIITSVVVRNITNDGLHIDTGVDNTFVNGFIADTCKNGINVISGSTNTYVNDAKIIKSSTSAVISAADLTINGLFLAATTGDGIAIMQATAGNFTLQNAHLTSTALVSATVLQVSGGTARLNGVRIEIPSGNNATALYCTGGTTYLENVAVVGFANSFSLYVGGGTVYIGDGCDFGTLGTPFTFASGTVIVSQFARETSKAVTTADVTMTLSEAQAQGLTTTGLLTAARNVILPTIAGMAWDVFCNNTGAFSTTFKTLAGTGIVVAQTKRARLKCDGTNIVRVTADL